MSFPSITLLTKPPAVQIQSIVKPPAVSNGRRGFTAAFVYMGITYPLICMAGYWVRLPPQTAVPFLFYLPCADLQYASPSVHCRLAAHAAYCRRRLHGTPLIHLGPANRAALGVQAFGNAVNPVFTLSLPQSTGWVNVTLQVLLVVQSCINYQLWARPT